MKNNQNTLNKNTSVATVLIVTGLFSILVLYIASLINGVDPFGCPPGTKTISSPMSIEKWCVEE